MSSVLNGLKVGQQYEVMEGLGRGSIVTIDGYSANGMKWTIKTDQYNSVPFILDNIVIQNYMRNRQWVLTNTPARNFEPDRKDRLSTVEEE